MASLVLLLWTLWCCLPRNVNPFSLRPRKATGIVNDPYSSSTSSSIFTNQGSPSLPSDDVRSPHLIFPGGGIYFYWQAGAVTYLREHGYHLENVTMCGASAGALTATLTATGVDFVTATELALQLAAQAGVWNRQGGLQGIWGPLIYTWLDELLPENALDLVGCGRSSIDSEATDSRLSVLLTPVPALLEKQRISSFQDRNDLIRANMASVHLPWFLDSKLTASFRGRPYIDGSFMAQPHDYLPLSSSSSPLNVKDGGNSDSTTTLILDYNQDSTYQSTSLLSFVEAATPDGIYKILEDGKRHAARMEEQGLFSMLPRIKTYKINT